MEKMTDIVKPAEGGNMLIQDSSRGSGLSNMTSYLLDNCLGFWGIKKKE